MRRAFNPPLLSDFGAIGAGRRFGGGGGFRPAVARGVFGAGSGFRVGWRTVGEGFVSVFWEFFASISGAFILAGGLGTGLSFYGFWTLSCYFLIPSLVSFGNSYIPCL